MVLAAFIAQTIAYQRFARKSMSDSLKFAAISSGITFVALLLIAPFIESLALLGLIFLAIPFVVAKQIARVQNVEQFYFAQLGLQLVVTAALFAIAGFVDFTAAILISI